jgi:S1-C subfamily serine protease
MIHPYIFTKPVTLFIVFCISCFSASSALALPSPAGNEKKTISVGLMDVDVDTTVKFSVITAKKKEKKIKGEAVNYYFGDPTYQQKDLELFDKTRLILFTDEDDYDDYSGIVKPKVFLQPVVVALRSDFKGGEYLYELVGKYEVDFVWKVFYADNTEKEIASFKFTCKSIREKGDGLGLLSDVLHGAVDSLLKTDTLVSFLEKKHSEYQKNVKLEKLAITGYQVRTFPTKKESLKNGMEATVTVTQDENNGSGFIISSSGYIITNYFTVKDTGKINVTLNNETETEAELVRFNESYDIALLKIKTPVTGIFSLEDYSLVEPGEIIFAIGTPVHRQLGQTLTSGIMSGKRKINGVQLIQTDVGLNDGNSGGPIMRANGEAIGMVTFKLHSFGVEGIGFFLPATEIARVLNLDLVK